jgi:hypothetical protein
LAGIEFSLCGAYGDDSAQINGGLIIGKSGNTDEVIDGASPHGIITPRTENFQVKNVKFFNFDFNDAAALGSCSHCFHPASTDSGARQVTLTNLEFTDVAKKIRHQYPFRAIYYDTDGTTTGKGAQSWSTYFYEFHLQPGCEHAEETHNGVVCDNSVQVRRVIFHDWKPNGLFSGMGFKVLKYDDDVIGAMDADAKEAYLLDKSNYGTMPFKKFGPPGNSWATPFVTGHKYKIHWGITGLDFTRMRLTLSQRWEETDLPLYFVHNFTDVR